MLESNDHSSSPCTAQLQRDFNWLRFDDALEKPFRRKYADLGIHRYRTALKLGLVLVLVIAALDWLTLHADVGASVAFAKLALLLPVPIAALWIAWHPSHYRYTGFWMGAAVVAVGCGLCLVHALAADHGVLLPYDSILLTIVFCYFITGLLLPWNAVCALLISAACLASEIVVGVRGGELAYDVAHLAAANAIGIVGSYLAERVFRLNFLHAGAAQELAGLDMLTNLPDNSAFRSQLEQRWQQAAEEGCALGLLLVDVDYFKRYDDRAGHVAADHAIRQISRRVQGSVRSPLDIVARLDDDEFAVLMYDVDRTTADQAARAVLEDVDAMRLPHADSPISDVLTVSIGVAVVDPDAAHGCERILMEGHDALDAAKRAERHGIRFSDETKAESRRPTAELPASGQLAAS